MFLHFFIAVKEASNVFLNIKLTTPRVPSRKIMRAFIDMRNELCHANMQPRFQGTTTLRTRLASNMR